MADSRELKEIIKKIILQLFPELSGYHQVIKARVLALHESAGTVDDFNKCYSVDVQPLTPDGKSDGQSPVIHDVPIDVIWAGNNRGIFCLPVVGAVVRIGYYYNDPSLPYVSGVTGDGQNVPSHPLDNIIIQQETDRKIEIANDGAITVQQSDDTKMKIAADTSILIQQANGISIEIDQEGKIKVIGNTVELDGGSGMPAGVVTQMCACPFTGAVHSDYSLDVKASKG